MREYVSIYRKDKVVPMVLNILKKENINISADCIKVWSTSHMLVNDVIGGIGYVKSLGYNTIVYTNTVPLKDKLSKDYGVKIIDIDDLRHLAVKHDEWNLYDEL